MESKTKYLATEKEIKDIFSKNGIGEVTAISELGDGEFNAAYKVTVNGKDHVLKIAPPPDAKVVNHEHDMMRAEVFWYEQMREHTGIRIPGIYARDFSRSIIGSDYFIMEMLKGKTLSELELSEEEKDAVSEKKINMLTQIHAIENNRFGYEQVKLFDTWYEAILDMSRNLVDDCKKTGQKTDDGERFLELIEKNKAVLTDVPCRMVNFDLWDSNVLYLEGELAWIDPERSFWGDPVADFITLGSGQKTPLDKKENEIRIYNKYAREKITADDAGCRRYAVATAYLALIEEVEKYYRYDTKHPNYIRNTIDAKDMYDMAFSILSK